MHDTQLGLTLEEHAAAFSGPIQHGGGPVGKTLLHDKWLERSRVGRYTEAAGCQRGRE
jgi:hypothetical protein